MSDRDSIVRRLVAGGHITPEERHILGGYVTREEVRAAIARALETDGRFPLDVRGYGGHQLVLDARGVRLVVHRNSRRGVGQRFESLEAAIDVYMNAELGPSCWGIPLRLAPSR